jgi:hypothetical protein
LNLVDQHVSQAVSPESTHLGCFESAFLGEFKEVFGTEIQEMGGLVGKQELTSLCHVRFLLKMRNRLWIEKTLDGRKKRPHLGKVMAWPYPGKDRAQYG